MPENSLVKLPHSRYDIRMNNLINILIEAAHHASIVPLATEATIYAMKSFGEQAMTLPVLAAILGAALGHSFNWWLGKMLMRLPSAPKNEYKYKVIAEYFNRYFFVVLVLAPLSLGNVLVVAAGMLGCPLKKTLPAVLIGLCYYYGRLV